jgi:hypothetical protein
VLLRSVFFIENPPSPMMMPSGFRNSLFYLPESPQKPPAPVNSSSAFLAQFFGRFSFLPPNMVEDFGHAGFTGAIGAAEEIFLGLDAVTDNFTAAIGADRRQLVYGALETIENVTVAGRHDFKR